jgi:hypothetical protein
MNKFINTMSVLILAFVVIILLLSSCRTSGYGCHGNSRTMTGEGMFKRGSRLN